MDQSTTPTVPVNTPSSEDLKPQTPVKLYPKGREITNLRRRISRRTGAWPAA